MRFDAEQFPAEYVLTGGLLVDPASRQESSLIGSVRSTTASWCCPVSRATLTFFALSPFSKT